MSMHAILTGLMALTIASITQAQTSLDSRLSVQRTDSGQIRLTWNVPATAVVLEQTLVLGSQASWQAVTQTPTVTGSEAAVLLPLEQRERYFRLRSNAPLGPVRLAESSPQNGERNVAVTRETIFRFERPLAAATTMDTTRFFAEFGGRHLLARAEISSDRLKATLFYLEPLPGSARVRVTLRGAGLTDAAGQALDLDGDGTAGGDGVIEFETVSLTPVARTAVIGRVFASQLATGEVGGSVNRPLAGVTITVDGQEETLRAVTDAMGNFKLDPAPAGTFFVHIDGHTSPESNWPDGSYYPVVGKSWTAEAGLDNNLAGGNGEVFLPLVTQGTLQPVNANAETTITFPASILARNPELAGVEVKIPANSLFSDNGTRGGRVGIAPVPPDRLPSPLPFGLEFPLVITIQTDGPSNFDVPVPVRFPNLPDPVTGEKLPPGAKSALWSFNHDTGEWEVVGPMTVTPDGAFVETDPGVGVRQPGWHGSRRGTRGKKGGGTCPCDTCSLDEGGGGGELHAAADPSCCTKRNLAISGGVQCLGSMILAFPKVIPAVGCGISFAQGILGTGADCYINPSGCGGTALMNLGGSLLGCIPWGVGSLLSGSLTCGSFGKSLVDALVCDPAKPLQAAAVGGVVVDVGGALGGGGLGAVLDITASAAAARAISDDEAELYQALAAFDTALLGTPKLGQVKLADLGVALDFINALKAALNPGGPGTIVVTDAERTALRQLPLPANISRADADAMISRLERFVQGTLPENELNGPAIAQAALRLRDVLAKLSAKGWTTIGQNLFGGTVQAFQTMDAAVNHRPQVQAPLHYLMTLLRDGTVRRGQLNSLGTFGEIILLPDELYSVEYLHPTTLETAVTIFRSGPNGGDTLIPRTELGHYDQSDPDNDGLSDTAERVLGTNPANADTDSDGLLDGAEFLQGLDPLGGLIARTGVIASAPVQGTAVDITALNDLAVVAGREAGVSVLNIFNGLNPIVVAQVDTPGTANRVAMADNFVAVADGASGLAIIDIAVPARARVVRQVPMEGAAEAVAATAGIAFVGLDSGKVVAVDMSTGSILQTLDAGNFVHDLGLDAGVLFALTGRELIAWSLGPDFLAPLGRIDHVRYFAEGITGRKRLSVGGGLAYATVYPGYDVFNVSNPSAMQQVGLSIDAGPNSFKQIVPNGSGLGVAAVGVNPRQDGTHDVNLYDVSNPAVTTQFLGTLTTPDVARALSIYNGLAYVADSTGMQVVSYLPYDALGEPPTVTLQHSQANGLVEEGKRLFLRAAVTDDVQVRNVEFYIDGAKAGTDGNFPFSWTFLAPEATAAKSNLVLRAKASDTGGNTTWSEELTLQLVKDATPPKVRSLSPRDGAILPGAATLAAFFSEPIDTATLTAGTVKVTWAGPDGQFGTADDQVVTPFDIEFREEVLGVFLAFAPPLAAGPHRVELSAGIKDLFGLPLENPLAYNVRIFTAGADRDGDGVPDSLEVFLGLNPDNADSDGDGLPDGDEDFDGDGLSNAGEVLLGYDPGAVDSDGNGVRDGNEDFDKDGITDGEEVIAGADGFVTDPTLPDTDGDGVPDNLEVALGLNPVRPGDGDADVVIDGRNVTVNGRVKLRSLALINGAVLSHPAAGREANVGLELVVSNLTVDAGSKIDVSARGYLGAAMPGNPTGQGRTLGNVEGSTRRNGGSYGGLGAYGNTEQTVNAVYGDFRDPNDLGSGGGSDSGPAGQGGGLLRIHATNVEVQGLILADGGAGSRFAGGGSGGSILIEATTLTGDGAVRADGGYIIGFAEAGGGGGGRIAVLASNISGNVAQNLRARGGDGLNVGAPGTVYLRVGAEPGQLIIRGRGRETPVPELVAGERLLLDDVRVAAEHLVLGELRLINSAVLTHPGATLTGAPRLEIQATTILIETNSAIDASGRGYLGASSGGNASQRGRTIGNAEGSTRRNGGSYGGWGAYGNTEQLVAALYGDYHNPNEAGSGGGSDSGAAGNGGGLIRIAAQRVVVEGAIRANGWPGSRFAGGGSGGGIRIEAGVIEGAGTIEANGGDIVGFAESGGGGGGRIAIYTPAGGGAIGPAVLALGGAGFNKGASGTIYTQAGTAAGQTVVRGDGRETPLPQIQAGERLMLDQARVFARQMNVGELRLVNGAVLTQEGATTTTDSRLEITAGVIFIEAGSRIDVSGRGYLGGLSGANASFQEGRTLGHAAGSTRRNGGSYGGLGATGNAEQIVNGIYGDFRNPNELGSGGGSDSGPAGPGGGLLRIVAQQLAVEGDILANGLNGSRYAGGGSGGGIRIQAGSISGAGIIRANGGSIEGFAESGGGGGGRVAVYYETSTGTVLETIQALGGPGLGTGGSGTIYVKRGADVGELIVRGAGRETPLPEGSIGERLLVDGARVVVSQLALNELRLLNGAALTHPGATTEAVSRLELTVDRLLIDASSRIDANGRGYLGGRNGANGAFNEGRTLGNVPGSVRRSGGSYGGLGAFGNAERIVNHVYGNFRNPNELGSGGGSDSGPGGNGGGLVRITANRIELHGEIAAEGISGSRYAGGGSGGGIKIVTQVLLGAGAMQARGGTIEGFAESGSGGGGRVAVIYTDASGFDLTRISAAGGAAGLGIGSPGTIYLQRAGTVLGDLSIDGKGIAPSRATPLHTLIGRENTSLTASTLTDDEADFEPGSLVGLSLNPNTAQSKTFLIVANTEDTITVAAADGAMTAVAQNGEPYSAGFQTDRLIIRDGAVVEIFDGDAFQTDRSGSLRTGTLLLESNALLTHPPATTSTIYGLDLAISGTVTVDASSAIDVGSRGYLGGRSASNAGSNEGRTLGNVAGSTRRNGGGYGGLGGTGNTEQTVNAVYGDFRNPLELGSGGGSDAEVGGSGGGRISLNAVVLHLEGRIAANGGSGSRYAGGGSGGAINIHASTIAGNGVLQANGGSILVFAESGGGGGGRIALHYTTVTGNAVANAQALGGTGVTQGAPGTVYRKAASAPGELTFRGTGRETPLPVLGAEEALILDQAALSSQALALGELRLLNGARLTHPASTLTTQPRLEINARTVLIDVTSAIDVSQRGYLGARSGLNGSFNEGRTVANALGSERRNGGSYGGLGGLGNARGTVNPVYGDPLDPNQLGSGGGADSDSGGTGGGLVRLVCQSLTLDGQIAADGGPGARYGAGGSGGGVKITTGSLAGGGGIHANGGSTSSVTESGGGGGGRVAITYTTLSGFDLAKVTAKGGTPGVNAGEPGTVMIQGLPVPQRQLSWLRRLLK